MSIPKNVLVLILIVPALLFIVQFFLCKMQSKVALLLPILVACCFILVGFYAIILAVLLLCIYATMENIQKKKQQKQSELEKMYRQDLD